MFWSVPALGLVALALLAQPAFNQSAFLYLNHVAASLSDVFWSGLTVLGDTLVALCLMLLILRWRTDLVIAVLIASLPATLLSHGFKDALDVARPYAVLGDQVHVIGKTLRAGSFPSGHTTTIFVLAGVLVGGLKSRVLTLSTLAVALLVGFSRVAVGAHWPIDVAGGVLCGWLSALAGLYWVRRVDWAKSERVPRLLGLFFTVCALVLLFDYESGYPLARRMEQAIALLTMVFFWGYAYRQPFRVSGPA